MGEKDILKFTDSWRRKKTSVFIGNVERRLRNFRPHISIVRHVLYNIQRWSRFDLAKTKKNEEQNRPWS